VNYSDFKEVGWTPVNYSDFKEVGRTPVNYSDFKEVGWTVFHRSDILRSRRSSDRFAFLLSHAFYFTFI